MPKIDKKPDELQIYNKIAAQCATTEIAPNDALKKMTGWGLDEEKALKVLAKLEKEHFIDEDRYARAFSHDKFRQTRWGRNKIAFALRQKKINASSIRQALAEIPQDEYEESARQLLSAKIKTITARNTYEAYGKMMRFATNRGFESDLAAPIIESLLNAKEQDEETETLF